jgi:hypothetical protein
MRTMVLLAAFVFAIVFGGYLVYLASKHQKYFEREKDYEQAFSLLQKSFPHDAFFMKWGKIVLLAGEAVLALLALLSKN